VIKPRLALGLVVGLALCCGPALVGCGGDDELAPEGLPKLDVTSPAFAEGQPIPVEYTCDGADVSPPLVWSGVPASAQSLVLVVDDPDAPSGTYVHWIVGGIDPATPGLDKGAAPAEAWEAPNSADQRAYAGPCPPSGTHNYRFTLYALKNRPDPNPTREAALDQIRESAIASGRLTGTYRKR
jgi:Raf kinase inhibitor-like YbhB/YbcL family protein